MEGRTARAREEARGRWHAKQPSPKQERHCLIASSASSFLCASASDGDDGDLAGDDPGGATGSGPLQSRPQASAAIILKCTAAASLRLPLSSRALANMLRGRRRLWRVRESGVETVQDMAWRMG